MSYQARDSKNANSALIVTVTPEDFPEEGPLGGIAFQRNLEKRAWEIGKGKIPVQLFGDYKLHQKSSAFGEIEPQTVSYTHLDVYKRQVQDNDIVDEIRDLDMTHLTPMEAMNILYNLQNKIKNRW